MGRECGSSTARHKEGELRGVIRRRRASAVVGALVLLWALGGVPASGERPVRVAYSVQVLDPPLAPYYAIAHYLGYWKEEGLEVVPSFHAGCGNAMQVLASGQADVSHNCWLTLAQAVDKGVPVIGFYNYFHEAVFVPAAPAGSGIREVRDLKGKTVGVQSLGAANVYIVRGAAQSAGLDPDRDITFVGLGLGPSVAAAVQSRRVDVLAYWPEVYQQVEDATGIRLSMMTAPEFRRAKLANLWVTTPSFLSAHPDVLVGLARGFAKATIFALENPEGAVRIAWRVFPESKPKDIPEEQALRLAVRLLDARRQAWRPPAGEAWGSVRPEDMVAYVDFFKTAGVLQNRIRPGSLFTDELLAEINRFDAEAVRRQARDFKL